MSWKSKKRLLISHHGLRGLLIAIKTHGYLVHVLFFINFNSI